MPRVGSLNRKRRPFGSEDARQTYLNGETAAALMANVDELLPAPPELLPADVLAAK